MFSLPAVGENKDVAVLLPSYEMFTEGTQSEDGAKAVFNMVKHAVKDAGQNVADPEETGAVLQTLSGKHAGHCDNASCCQKIAESVGAWNAVSVRVVDKEAHFLLTIDYAVGERLEAKVFGNRASLLEDIYGNVNKTLKANTPEPTGGDDPPVDETTDPDAGTEGATSEPKNGLKPAAFATSLAITGALAVGFGVTEAVGLKRKSDLEGMPAGLEFNEEQKSLKTLRVVDGVLFGATLAAAATSTVLFFLTDFGKDKEKDDGNSQPIISVGPTSNGAMMTINGSF